MNADADQGRDSIRNYGSVAPVDAADNDGYANSIEDSADLTGVDRLDDIDENKSVYRLKVE